MLKNVFALPLEDPRMSGLQVGLVDIFLLHLRPRQCFQLDFAEHSTRRNLLALE